MGMTAVRPRPVLKMILSRLSSALKDQNWLAVALEFLIVLSGVVIGFQVNAWNEARMARADYSDALAEIDAQIGADIGEIDYQIGRIDAALALAQTVFPALEACEVPPGGMTALTDLISELGNDVVPTLESRGAERILASERLRARAGAEVLGALEAYASLLAEENSQLAVNFQLLWSVHINSHPAVSFDLSLQDSPYGQAVIAAPLSEVCSDPEFKRRFAYSHGFFVTFKRRLEAVRSAAARTRAVVDEAAG